MILQNIKETKRYGHTFGWSVGRTFGRTTWKQYTLPQTQFAGGGGIKISQERLKLGSWYLILGVDNLISFW